MSKQSKALQDSRRDFLRGVAVLGGAATVAVAAGSAVADAPEPSAARPAAAEGSKGYHVTPHIREYYDKARF